MTVEMVRIINMSHINLDANYKSMGAISEIINENDERVLTNQTYCKDECIQFNVH